MAAPGAGGGGGGIGIILRDRGDRRPRWRRRRRDGLWRSRGWRRNGGLPQHVTAAQLLCQLHHQRSGRLRPGALGKLRLQAANGLDSLGKENRPPGSGCAPARRTPRLCSALSDQSTRRATPEWLRSTGRRKSGPWRAPSWLTRLGSGAARSASLPAISEMATIARTPSSSFADLEGSPQLIS